MAEKRLSEAAGTMAYSKLPRLEPSPGHILAASACKSSVPLGHGANSHYNYQGTYFSYAPQCHKVPKPLAQWSSTESYASCTNGAGSQQCRPEKTRCMLYRQEQDGFGMWVQNSSYEKNKDCSVGDTLEPEEKWAQYTGHADFIPQGWIQGFPMWHATQGPTGYSPLAAPRPLHRNHFYCTETSCFPRVSRASGMLAESPSKWLMDTEWATLSSEHQAGCGDAMSQKAPTDEFGFPPFHQSWKDAAAASASFSPYRKTFENLQVAPSVAAGDANYPAGCHNQNSTPEEWARSPCPKAWSQLPPPAIPLAAPQPLIYQERSSACHRLPSYPLITHEQIMLYQQSVAQAERQKPLLALPACESFNFPATEEPQFPARTRFPPSPRTYYPSDSPPVTSPRLKTSREYNPHQNSPASIAFEQRSHLQACPLTEGTWCSSREGMQDQHTVDNPGKPTNESFQCPQVPLQSQAFQPLDAAERPPVCFDSHGQTQETSGGAGKGQDQEDGPLYTEKPSRMNCEEKKRAVDTDGTPQSGMCIVIPDSPVKSQDSYLKADIPRTPVPKCSDPSAPRVPQSPEEEWRGLKSPETPPPPSSPPMPVIHNVFSLAPYRDYLEGVTDSVTLPSSKGCPTENPGHHKSWASAEGKTSPRPPTAGSLKTTGVVPDQGKETAGDAAAENGGTDTSSNCIMREKGGGGHASLCESYQVSESHQAYLNALVTSRPGTTDYVSKPAKDDCDLDGSLQTESLPDIPNAQKSAGTTEALKRETGKRNGGGVNVGQGATQAINPPALQPSLKSASEEKSNFQSSTAFLYEKFKILKSHAAGTSSMIQPDFLLLLPSSQMAVAPNTFLVEHGCPQAAAHVSNLPVQKSCLQAATWPNGLPAPQAALQTPAQPGPQPPRDQDKRINIKQPDTVNTLPAAAAAVSGEASALLPSSCKSLSPKEYFTALHASVCSTISDSVSTSSPELLREWLEKAEPEKEPKQRTPGSVKTKNGSKAPKKPSRGEAVWLTFKDVATRLKQVLAQLDIYLLMNKCPFPHVVRAGTIFIPIHVVKETLFGNLSGASVDHVLLSHRVELRPTTLSEEKLLRDLQLKSCTSRMLKLLAFKQLPDIYPDLLGIHWHHCVKQQLGPSSQAGLQASK